MDNNLPNLPQSGNDIPDTQSSNAPDVPEAPPNPEPAVVLNTGGQNQSKSGGKKMIATIFGLAVVAILSGGVFVATKLTQQPQEATPSEAKKADGTVEVRGRTVYVMENGKKKAKKIKNKNTWKAMKANANQNESSVTEAYKNVTTVKEFNDRVYRDLVKNQVYGGKVEEFTYYECDQANSDGTCGHWIGGTYTNPGDIWKYISQNLDANANFYFCPDGFKDKRTCNSGELSTSRTVMDVFYLLTGTGEHKEMCGAFQSDSQGLIGNDSGNPTTSTNIKAGSGDSMLGFSFPCGGKDEVTDGGGGEDQFYSCDSLSMSKEGVELNDTVTFSCEGSFYGYSPVAYFRYSFDGGTTFTNEGVTHNLADENPAMMDLTIDKYGSWVVQCRVCTDETNTDCTDWNSTAE